MAKVTPDEATLLSRFRRAGAGTILGVIAVYIAAGIFELPLLRESFQVEPTVLGILVGAFLLLVGVEAVNRIPGIGSNRDDK